jgi:hypothetical protein
MMDSASSSNRQSSSAPAPEVAPVRLAGEPPHNLRHGDHDAVSSNSNSLDAGQLHSLAGAPQDSDPPAPTISPIAAPVWVQRLQLVVLVVFCIELGMLLAVLPWTRVWLENSLLTNYPALRAVAHQNFVRGAVSGLGLVDIWIGIWEAVHYREIRPSA